MQICYAITSAAFAAIFLVAIIIFGETAARNIAIAAAFFGCASQFTGQDPGAYPLSIYLAYVAFALAILAYVYLLLGS